MERRSQNYSFNLLQSFFVSLLVSPSMFHPSAFLVWVLSFFKFEDYVHHFPMLFCAHIFWPTWIHQLRPQTAPSITRTFSASDTDRTIRIHFSYQCRAAPLHDAFPHLFSLELNSTFIHHTFQASSCSF